MMTRQHSLDLYRSVAGTRLGQVTSDGLPSEEIPDEPVFSHVFQTALHAGQAIAAEAASAIERLVQSGFERADLDKLAADAKSLSKDQTTSLRTIAVIGDSGEGTFEGGLCNTT